MNEDTISHEDLVAGLQDLRLPDVAVGGLAADIVVSAAVGLLLAFGLGFFLSVVLRRGARGEVPVRLADQIRDLRGLPEEERMVALLHLLAERDPVAAAQLRDRLYRAGAFPDVVELEERLSGHA
jgi:hypothetical protein